MFSDSTAVTGAAPSTEIEYRLDHYPEAQELLDTALVINTGPYPIYLQDLELMECHVRAIGKVFDNLDELLASSPTWEGT